MERSSGVRKGAWAEEEDILLSQCINKYGEGKWHHVPLKAGLNRCRKSCRLRWLNYLRPNIKRGDFKADEVDLIIRLHTLLGNRWSLIAGRIPGRTANDVKNYWNTHLRKKVLCHSNNVEVKAPDVVVKVNIIKPRPRTFSKNLTLLSGKSPTAESFRPNSNTINTSPTPTSSDNLIAWWECLLDDKEGDETAASTISGVHEEPNPNLWVNETAPEAKVGGFFDEDMHIPSCLADFSSETGLWDFLNAEEGAA